MKNSIDLSLTEANDSTLARVVLNTPARFHTFDLARQLHSRGMLMAIFTGYPRFKLRGENLPRGLVHSFPYFEAVYIAMLRMKFSGSIKDILSREISIFGHRVLDAHVAKSMPSCDVFVSLSGCGWKAGRKAQRMGASYICDRGSTHIRFQNRVLEAEYQKHGIPFTATDARVIAAEEQEYQQADFISVPSQVCLQSFVEMGVSIEKLRCIPYGVDLSSFYPVGQPDPDQFNVLFVGGASIRKGVPYLLQAFSNLQHPQKSLTFVGTVSAEIQPLIDQKMADGEAISCVGHFPQDKLKRIMSESHVLALSSVEEGLALVQPQAMACACPIVATVATGAQDLFSNGVEGYIVADRDVKALTERLQHLADHPEVRERMSIAARHRVETFGGWDRYGDSWAALCNEISAAKKK